VTGRVDALRKREAAARDVQARVTRVGPWVQVHVIALGADRWMKFTDAEAAQLRDDLTAVLEAGPDE
jgi:hypothetical protein